MLFIQFYLFARVYLIFFLPFHKINVNKQCKENPTHSIDEFRLGLDFVCVHCTVCALILFIWGAVLFLYIQCYLLAYIVPLVCVQCNLYALNTIYLSQMLLKCLQCYRILMCVQNNLLEYSAFFPQSTIFVISS